MADKKLKKSSTNTTSTKKVSPERRNTTEKQKGSKDSVKFTYKTTFASKTYSKKSEISELIKKEKVELKKRLSSRNIKVSSIVKITKYGHIQLKNGKKFSSSMKYYIFTSDKKYIFNFSKRLN